MALDSRSWRVCIVGGGIAGIASALALAKELGPREPNLQVTVYERHDVLSTSGGAINLTPVAQRHLDRLGVLEELDRQGADAGADVDAIELFSSRSGRSLGSIDFTDGQGKGVNGYKGRRVMRIVLSLAMLAVIERHPNIRIVYGKKLTGVSETSNQTILHFDDKTSAAGDLVLGCDGVHSVLRTHYVDPGRPSDYTGLSFLQTTVDTPPPSSAKSTRPSTSTSYTDSTQSSRTRSISTPSHPSQGPTMHPAPFKTSGLAVSRHGDLLGSYCDRDRATLFLAAIVQIPESLLPRYRLDPPSFELSASEYAADQRRRASVHSALQSEIQSRFARSGSSWIRDVARLKTNWMLYPVYQVRPGGKWCRGNVILLGDAAHAVRLPPIYIP